MCAWNLHTTLMEVNLSRACPHCLQSLKSLLQQAFSISESICATRCRQHERAPPGSADCVTRQHMRVAGHVLQPEAPAAVHLPGR